MFFRLNLGKEIEITTDNQLQCSQIFSKSQVDVLINSVLIKKKTCSRKEVRKECNSRQVPHAISAERKQNKWWKRYEREKKRK